MQRTLELRGSVSLENYDRLTNKQMNFRVHWDFTLSIRVGTGSGFFLDPDPVEKKTWIRIRIRFVTRGLIRIRIRSISDRIRNPIATKTIFNRV